MANPNVSTSKTSDNLASTLTSNIHDASQKLRDTSDRLISNANTKAHDIVEEVSDRASTIYDQTSEWLESNPAVGYVALGAVCGLLGFFMGRSMNSNKVESKFREI